MSFKILPLMSMTMIYLPTAVVYIVNTLQPPSHPFLPWSVDHAPKPSVSRKAIPLARHPARYSSFSTHACVVIPLCWLLMMQSDTNVILSFRNRSCYIPRPNPWGKFIARLGLWQVRTAPISYPLPPAPPIRSRTEDRLKSLVTIHSCTQTEHKTYLGS